MECSTIQPRIIATCFSITAFVAALLIGAIWAGNPMLTVLYRALIVMLACYPIGLVVGGILQRVIEEDIEAYRQAHPIPGEDDSQTRSDKTADDGPASAAEGT